MKLALWIGFVLTFLTGCGGGTGTPESYGPAGATLLKPPSTAQRPLQGVLYVPVYSSIYWGAGVKRDLIDLTATLSVRNVSLTAPVVLDSVEYYDSAGKKVRDYVNEASELGPMATVEFLVMRSDTAGGPGANFLVHWSAAEGAEEPLTEAVMLGQSGNAGISFLTSGKPVKGSRP